MKYPSFGDSNLKTVNEALDIAEDKTGDFYKFSLGQWKRHRYDVKTQAELHNDEITSFAFALLNKCSNITKGFESKTKSVHQDQRSCRTYRPSLSGVSAAISQQ